MKLDHEKWLVLIEYKYYMIILMFAASVAVMFLTTDTVVNQNA